MCVICTEYMKEKLTFREMFRGLEELLSTAKNDENLEHYLELLEALFNDMIKNDRIYSEKK